MKWIKSVLWWLPLASLCAIPLLAVGSSRYEDDSYATLTRAKTLKCYLDGGCSAEWTQEGLKTELQKKFSDDPSQNTMVFDIIDLEKGLAKKVMDSGHSFDARVMKINGQLTFLETWADGDIVITTIFPKKDKNTGKYLLVHSRHSSFPVDKMPIPSQYYGTCEVLR